MRILVAMSGGVDSSMTAKILKDLGHEVIGCYAKLHNKPNYHEENIRKIKKVSEFLGIQHHILDLQDEFKAAVYEPFIKAYEAGITPNPCAICNRQIKFGKIWEFAKSLKCDSVATGHYARIVQKDGSFFIKTAADPSKDQSYFLANIEPEILPNIIFPLGDKFKTDIKAAAAQIPQIAELATQKESSEICFVQTTYLDILREHTNPDNPGIVRNADGDAIGTHFGYMHYTIGKRKGFRINGAHEPHFVLSTNPLKNEIVVGKKEELDCDEFYIKNFNDFTNSVATTINSFVKIRYRSHKIPCEIELLNSDKYAAKVRLKTAASGVASGQLAVFYSEDDLVLASGFIAYSGDGDD